MHNEHSMHFNPDEMISIPSIAVVCTTFLLDIINSGGAMSTLTIVGAALGIFYHVIKIFFEILKNYREYKKSANSANSAEISRSNGEEK